MHVPTRDRTSHPAPFAQYFEEERRAEDARAAREAAEQARASIELEPAPQAPAAAREPAHDARESEAPASAGERAPARPEHARTAHP